MARRKYVERDIRAYLGLLRFVLGFEHVRGKGALSLDSEFLEYRDTSQWTGGANGDNDRQKKEGTLSSFACPFVQNWDILSRIQRTALYFEYDVQLTRGIGFSQISNFILGIDDIAAEPPIAFLACHYLSSPYNLAKPATFLTNFTSIGLAAKPSVFINLLNSWNSFAPP